MANCENWTWAELRSRIRQERRAFRLVRQLRAFPYIVSSVAFVSMLLFADRTCRQCRSIRERRLMRTHRADKHDCVSASSSVGLVGPRPPESRRRPGPSRSPAENQRCSDARLPRQFDFDIECRSKPAHTKALRPEWIAAKSNSIKFIYQKQKLPEASEV